MLKYLALTMGSLAIGGLLVAFVVVRNDKSMEQPDIASNLEDADACPVPSEPPAVAAEPSAAAPESTPYLQSPEEALTQDLALIAEARGWTLEQAQAHYRASEALDPITSRLAAERPDVFIGAALAEEPEQPPKVYIKGPADQTVRYIVATAEVQIEIVDNQPYSRLELDDRKLRVAYALQDMGFKNFGAGADITSGRVDAEVIRQEGLPDDPDEILAALPADVREGVTLAVSDARVGCDLDSESSTEEFGPLAVFRTDGAFQARGGTGPIHIGNECVTLTTETGQKLLLVWSLQEGGGEVAWNEEEKAIVFRSPRDSVVAIRDGDVITVGGGHLGSDRPPDRDPGWLAPLNESCTGERWMVGSVTKEG